MLDKRKAVGQRQAHLHSREAVLGSGVRRDGAARGIVVHRRTVGVYTAARQQGEHIGHQPLELRHMLWQSALRIGWRL